MARSGLQSRLDAILHRARGEEDTEVVERGVRVKTNGSHTLLDIRATRLTEPETLRGLLLVAFENARDERMEKTANATSDRVLELERELQYLKESYQSTVEELTSTNEELQSTNEELQSVNEELGTSKEEMQSLNEELQTVNSELQRKLEELTHTNDDMRNLLNGTDIATVFLDGYLRIKRFTEQMRKIIRLIPADIGRPIDDLGSRLQYSGFVDDAREVLRTLVYKEVEVPAENGTWYLMRILPYRTAENVIDGLVITFVDVTRVRAAQESERRLLSALANSPTSVFGQDKDLRYIWTCRSVFGRSPSELVGKTDEEVFGVEGGAPLAAVKRGVLGSGTPIRQKVRLQLGPAESTYDLYVEPVRATSGSVEGISCVATDVTAFDSRPSATATTPEVPK